MTHPGGSRVEYSYDAAGRLAGITPFQARRGFVFSYDLSGRRTGLSYPNGTTATYAYDPAGRLLSLTHKTSSGSTISSFAYALDAVGNRINRATPGNRAAYEYDGIYRLLSAVYSKGGPTKIQNEAYAYDPAGNRLASLPNRVYTYDAGNRLLNYKDNLYGHDANGNIVSKMEADDDHEGEAENEIEGWTYEYDYENRLTKAVKHDDDEIKIVTFKYDPFGRRIEKRVEEVENGEVETKVFSYLYDDEDVLVEYDGAGVMKTRYVHGPGIDEPLAMENGNVAYYYHADGLGSIVALSNASGRVAQAYEYDAFGRLHDRMNAVKQPYTFTGREWDKETGLYYYRARYYDPEIGRFTTKDPIGMGVGVKSPTETNLYLYAGNNPVRYTDPLGLFPVAPAIMACLANPHCATALMAGIIATTVAIQNAIDNLSKEKPKSEQCPSGGKWTCLAEVLSIGV
jgi:RHS repeat-associated protein